MNIASGDVTAMGRLAMSRQWGAWRCYGNGASLQRQSETEPACRDNASPQRQSEPAETERARSDGETERARRDTASTQGQANTQRQSCHVH